MLGSRYNEIRMNILFFLIPKSQVAYVEEDFTVRQVTEKLQNRGYSAIPILNKEGKYLDTISVGDLFWYLKTATGMNYKAAENVSSCQKGSGDPIRCEDGRSSQSRLASELCACVGRFGCFHGYCYKKSNN